MKVTTFWEAWGKKRIIFNNAPIPPSNKNIFIKVFYDMI